MPTDQNELREDCGRPEAWRGGGTMRRADEANARAEEMAMRRVAKAQALATGSRCPECGFRHALAASPTAGAERPTDDEIEAAACPEPSEEEVEAAAKASFATLGKTGVDLNEVPKLKALWTDAARAALLAARAVKGDK